MSGKKNKKVRGPIKNRTIIFWTIIIMLVVTIQVIGYDFAYSVEKALSYMEISHYSEIMRDEDEKEVQKIYEEIGDSSTQFILDYSCFYLSQFSLSATNMEFLEGITDSELYYITKQKDGENYRITKTKNSEALSLSDDEISELVSVRWIELTNDDGEECIFFASKFGSGYLIVKYNGNAYSESDLNIRSATTTYQNINIWIDSDMTVISSTDASFVGKKLEDITTLTLDDSSYLTKLDTYGVGVYLLSDEGDKKLISFLSLSAVMEDIFRGAIAPVFLFWVVIGTILFYALKIRKNKNDAVAQNNNVYTVFGRKIIVNRTIISHIAALGIFGLILIVVSLFYVRSLISFSDQNIFACSALKSLSESYDTNQETLEKEKKMLEQTLTGEANIIAYMFMAQPDSVNSDVVKKLTTRIELVNEISVLDRAGVVIASSSGNEGYSYGRNESGVGDLCWSVLDGDVQSGIFHRQTMDDGDYEYVVASRRPDSKGLVLIDITMKDIADFYDKWSLEETVKTADIGEALCMVVSGDNPDTVYVTEPGKQTVNILDTTLDSTILESGFAGNKMIKGVRYYVNSLKDSEYDITFISALPLKNIPYSVAWACAVCFLIGICIFIIFICCCISIDTVSDGGENIVPDYSGEGFRTIFDKNSLIDESFKSVIGNMIMATGIFLVLMLGVDYLLEEQPLITYLLGSQWNKGVNLFSITMVLLIVVGSMVGGIILQKLIYLICNNMGPRGMTIGRLLGSLARFTILIVSIMWSLTELGCNLTVLLTGAGIAGAAISFCANSSINDLLSGFFIVFEGSFQIGDWIQVGDWRGQVLEIGMRTTKIAKSDCVKIINNSTMTNITVLDLTNSGALISIDIAYKEDAAKVIELIKNNQKRYRERIPQIEDGPYVKGVVDLGTNGVTIEMYAFGDQSYIAAMERGIRLVTKELFDENNIEIPFGQITLHQADEKRYF